MKENGAKLTARGDLDILPLHLAIRYCQLHGNNEELFRELVSKEVAQARTANGTSAILMALTTLDDPLPIVKILAENGAFPKELHKLLFDVAQNIDLEQRKYILISSIRYFADNSQLVPFISALIDAGADVDENCYLEEYDPEEESFCDDEKAKLRPIFEAIKLENLKLVQMLIDRHAELDNIYNEEGLPVILAAGYNLPLAKLLLDAGASLDECDLREGTYPLHESIGGVLPGYDSNGNKNLFKFLLDNNADLRVTDGAEKTVLECSLESENKAVVTALVDKIFVLEAADEDDASAAIAKYISTEDDELDEETTQLIRKLTGREIYTTEELEENEHNSKKETFEKFFAKLPIPKTDDEYADNLTRLQMTSYLLSEDGTDMDEVAESLRRLLRECL